MQIPFYIFGPYYMLFVQDIYK